MDVLSGFDVGRDRILAIRYYRSSTCSWPWIMRHLTPCTHFHGARGRAPSLNCIITIRYAPITMTQISVLAAQSNNCSA